MQQWKNRMRAITRMSLAMIWNATLSTGIFDFAVLETTLFPFLFCVPSRLSLNQFLSLRPILDQWWQSLAKGAKWSSRAVLADARHTKNDSFCQILLLAEKGVGETLGSPLIIYMHCKSGTVRLTLSKEVLGLYVLPWVIDWDHHNPEQTLEEKQLSSWGRYIMVFWLMCPSDVFPFLSWFLRHVCAADIANVDDSVELKHVSIYAYTNVYET